MRCNHSGLEWALYPMTGVLIGRDVDSKRPREEGHTKTEAGIGAGGALAKEVQGLPGATRS